MMREVVVDRHAVRRADDLEPPLDAGERPQPLGDPLGADADLGRHRDRRQRVAHVVRAEQRHLERRRTATRCRRTLNRVDRAGRLEIVRLPVDVRRQCRTSATRETRRRRQRARARAVGAEQQQAAAAARGSTSRRNASVTASKSA